MNSNKVALYSGHGCLSCGGTKGYGERVCRSCRHYYRVRIETSKGEATLGLFANSDTMAIDKAKMMSVALKPTSFEIVKGSN